MYKTMMFIFITASLFGCKEKPLEFYISRYYTGPCVVFLYPDKMHTIKKDNVILKNGLGWMTKENYGRMCAFKYTENKITLESIDIGNESVIVDTNHYVFRVGITTLTSKCSNRDLSMMTFFIGRKMDFFKWAQKDDNVLLFFDSIGVNWCNYYQTNFIP